jgi:hypothetical protein
MPRREFHYSNIWSRISIEYLARYMSAPNESESSESEYCSLHIKPKFSAVAVSVLASNDLPLSGYE